jgi:hypothetical protein
MELEHWPHLNFKVKVACQHLCISGKYREQE